MRLREKKTRQQTNLNQPSNFKRSASPEHLNSSEQNCSRNFSIKKTTSFIKSAFNRKPQQCKLFFQTNRLGPVWCWIWIPVISWTHRLYLNYVAWRRLHVSQEAGHVSAYSSKVQLDKISFAEVQLTPKCSLRNWKLAEETPA